MAHGNSMALGIFEHEWSSGNSKHRQTPAAPLSNAAANARGAGAFMQQCENEGFVRVVQFSGY